jgi:hypothetical protein
MIGYFDINSSAPRWLNKAQAARWAMMDVCNRLFCGKHREVFLEEGRTRYHFPQVRINDSLTRLYASINLAKLISLKTADLLVGQEPTIECPDEATMELIETLVNESNLAACLHEAAKDASQFGSAAMECAVLDGKPILQRINPMEIWPSGVRLPDGQYRSYTRYQECFSGDKEAVLKTVYSVGKITRTAFLKENTTGGEPVATSLEAISITRLNGQPLLPIEETKVDWPTILYYENVEKDDKGNAVSDYATLMDNFDKLNAKETQVTRVLLKHADPKMAMPIDNKTENGSAANAEAYFYRTKDDIPQYIVWNAEMQSALTDRDFTLFMACVEAEISPILLGLEKGAAPESARKMRLTAANTLAKVQRISTWFRPFARLCVVRPLELLAKSAMVPFQLNLDITVKLKDGLPIDELDEATRLSTLAGGRTIMSDEEAVRTRLPNPVEAQKAIEMLTKQHKADTPSILLDEPGETDNTEEPPEGGTPNDGDTNEDNTGDAGKDSNA